MAPNLRHVAIDQASVKGVKADLISGVVHITIDVPLAKALPIREDLAMLGFMDTPVEIEITQLQSELDLKFGKPDTSAGAILEEVAKEINQKPGMKAKVRRAHS